MMKGQLDVEMGADATPPPAPKSTPPTKARPQLMQRQKTLFGQQSFEMAEFDSKPKRKGRRSGHSSVSGTSDTPSGFLGRLSVHASLLGQNQHQNKGGDRFFDMNEDNTSPSTCAGSQHDANQVPTLKECRSHLKNEEAASYRRRAATCSHQVLDLLLDVVASIVLYIAYTLTLESVVTVSHAVAATYFFCVHHEHYAVKLDFSFLAFSVVFPLTFLIQSVFSRRDQALQRLVDFKASFCSTALLTLTCDWATKDGSSPTQGRRQLPSNFNAAVLEDFRHLAQLVYEYLSMPSVSNARNVVFVCKQHSTSRVHAMQNEIIKSLNDSMYDLAQHTEVMRHYGFPSGEASRLHQYHQYLQQRFEHLRVLKYYRTPQATRVFGQVYLFILPWLVGPYFGWVFEQTGQAYAFTMTLAGFIFLILLGLLNTHRGLEDPFVPEVTGWTPGIDNVKLEYEFASMIQAVEQYGSKVPGTIRSLPTPPTTTTTMVKNPESMDNPEAVLET